MARMENQGPEYRLKPVREERFQVSPPTLGDALPEIQVAPQVELLGHLGQGVRVDHRRACLRQLPLGRAGVMLVQVLGGDQLQDRIPEVFETLVVPRRLLRVLVGERAMSYRLE